MRQFVAIYRLARPFNAVTGALAVIMGGHVAGTGAWDKVAMAAIVTFLITGAGNAWNDYLDIEIDRINRPDRVLPSGQVKPHFALILSLVQTFLGLLIASFINLPAFLVSIIASIILYVYSWKLKSTVLMGNATVASISAMSIVFGGIAAGKVRPTFILAAIIGVAILGREVLKTLADYEGDLKQRCRTIATTWGKRWARVVFFVLAAITGWIMMVPFLLDIYEPVYAYIVSFGVYPVLLYAMIRVTRHSSSRQLERVSMVMKIDFLIWFAAVLLGAPSA